MRHRMVDKVGTFWNFVHLGIVYWGIQHFTHHNSIAVSAVAALLFLNSNMGNGQ